MENMEKCSGVNCPMQMGYDVANCQVKDCPFRTKPLNRYDLIRHFTIDQMAEFLHGLTSSLAVKSNGEYVINETEQIKEWITKGGANG